MLEADLAGEDYETVAGLIFTTLGRVPSAHEIVKKNGYRFEVETPFPSSDEVFNGPGGAQGGAGDTVRIRQSYWDIISKDHGRVSVGFQSPATDDITLLILQVDFDKEKKVKVGINFGKEGKAWKIQQVTFGAP